MKSIKFARTLLISLLFSIALPGAPLLYTLSYIPVGTGSGGAFDFPNLTQVLLCLGSGVLALPFITGSLDVMRFYTYPEFIPIHSCHGQRHARVRKLLAQRNERAAVAYLHRSNSERV